MAQESNQSRRPLGPSAGGSSYRGGGDGNGYNYNGYRGHGRGRYGGYRRGHNNGNGRSRYRGSRGGGYYGSSRREYGGSSYGKSNVGDYDRVRSSGPLSDYSQRRNEYPSYIPRTQNSSSTIGRDDQKDGKASEKANSIINVPESAVKDAHTVGKADLEETSKQTELSTKKKVDDVIESSGDFVEQKQRGETAEKIQNELISADYKPVGKAAVVPPPLGGKTKRKDSQSVSPNHSETSDEMDVEEEEEEGPILNGKKRNVSVEPPNDSEAETDVEKEAIPAPSRRTRRLHRLMRKTRRDEQEDSADEKDQKRADRDDKRRASSTSRPRKVSGRHGKDASGRSLLQRLCARGNYDEAKQLIESGSDVNDADYAGNTPLHEAALEGYVDIVNLLLDNKAEIDKQSGQMDRDTALIDASSNLHYEVVKLLVDRGADPTLANAQGDTPLDALEDEDRDVSSMSDDDLTALRKLRKLLVQYTKDWRRKHQHRRRSSTTDTEPDDSIARRRNNNTFFDFFTREGRSEIYTKVAENDVTYVLNYVSNLAGNRVPPDLLTLAARHGHTDIASLLLAFGAKVNYHDRNGRTPLMYAVGKDHIEMVKLLIENNADSLLKDDDDKTALDYALASDVADNKEIRLLRESEKTLLAQGRKSRPRGAGDEVKSGGKRLKRKRSQLDDEEEESNGEEEVRQQVNGKSEEDPSEEERRDSESAAEEEEEENYTDVEEAKETVREENERLVDEAPEETKDLTEQESSSSKTMRRKSSARMTSLSVSPDRVPPAMKRRKTVDKLNIVSLGGSPKPESVESESRSGSPAVQQSEIKARKEKDLDAQKAREALEMERLERKRARQQQIAKGIEQMERKRAEEEKAHKLQEMARQKKEEEEVARKKFELKAKQRAVQEEEVAEQKRLIRSYYPYGMKIAQFGHVPSREEILQYLPLYSFEVDGERCVVDVQVCLILGIENLYGECPELEKLPVSAELKPLLWNILWPMIGSFIINEDVPRGAGQTKAQWKLYESEERNFYDLVINWVRLDKFEQLLAEREELNVVKKTVDDVGICNVLIPKKVEMSRNSSLVTPISSRSNSQHGIDPADTELRLPAILEKKVRKALGMMRKNLW
ncbi:DEKNAAC100449 [Brettanomyces naardenensis]|uniref:DEKNAAC100449 n=1 Tax=Brettanomyces naardenensis TaxID=13370 RepID=A0A448YFR0_BRENA|nr:DEKNAAC100449 [Brettanomyces naardenensis]